jgi:hypothetical protein
MEHGLNRIEEENYLPSFVSIRGLVSFRNPQSAFEWLTPHERMRYTDKFDDPNLPGEIQVTVNLKEVTCGTELNILQEGVPAVIPAAACYLGWQESLILLAKLVEAETE